MSDKMKKFFSESPIIEDEMAWIKEMRDEFIRYKKRQRLVDVLCILAGLGLILLILAAAL